MVRGKDFEVDKETYERAKANGGYMVGADIDRYFNLSIIMGYGLYSCTVDEKDGKYICSWYRGESCD